MLQTPHTSSTRPHGEKVKTEAASRQVKAGRIEEGRTARHTFRDIKTHPGETANEPQGVIPVQKEALRLDYQIINDSAELWSPKSYFSML